MSLFKCYNCPGPGGVPGRDFEADKPVCPTCTLDGGHADGAGVVVRRETVHYQLPHKVLKVRGSGVRACDGKPAAASYTSPEPSAVNCPECRKTEAFRARAEERGELTLAHDAE